jgi:hypothetical protein
MRTALPTRYAIEVGKRAILFEFGKYIADRCGAEKFQP